MRGAAARAAGRLLELLDDEQAAAARHPFADDAARRWIEYRPQKRPGASLSGLSEPARKAAHQLLATALRPHAYAQAMAIVALEEVLDRAEGWRRGRHSEDYWVAVFGEPGDERWGWRFEGHHLSVSMTVDADEVYPTPVFLGANPATVSYAGHPVLRPLALEEEVARALLDALDPAQRGQAMVAAQAPADILSARSPRAAAIEPLGVPAHRLGPTPRALLDRLVGVYLDRLAPDLARAEAARLDPGRLHFAWAGPGEPGHGHYYRVQATDLLIEYDNTQNGANHAHTVLRRPGRDFGGDPLADHLTGDSGA
ncbi:MAG: hypothetical protein V7603_5202 [Micromonosporaceae bacterium]